MDKVAKFAVKLKKKAAEARQRGLQKAVVTQAERDFVQRVQALDAYKVQSDELIDLTKTKMLTGDAVKGISVNMLCVVFELVRKDQVKQKQLETDNRILEKRLHDTQATYIAELMQLRNSIRHIRMNEDSQNACTDMLSEQPLDAMYMFDPIRSFDPPVQKLVNDSVNEKVKEILESLDRPDAFAGLKQNAGPSARELELEELVPRLEAKASGYESTVAALRRELGMAEEKQNALQSEVRDLRDQVREERDKSAQIAGKLAEAEASCDRLTQRVTSLEETIQEKLAELREAARALEQESQRADAAEEQCRDLQKLLDDARERIRELEELCAEAQAKIADAERRCEEALNKLAETQARLERLEEEYKEKLRKKEEELAEERKLTAELKQKVADAEAAIEREREICAQKVAAAEERAAGALARVEELETELAEHKAVSEKIIAALETEKAALEEELATFREGMEKMRAEFDEKVAQVEAAAAKREAELREQMADFEGLMAEKHARIAELELEVEKLQKAVAELGQKVMELRELVRESGGQAADAFEAAFEETGLAEIAQNITAAPEQRRSRYVFERLYKDALRRLARLEGLREAIWQQEREQMYSVLGAKNQLQASISGVLSGEAEIVAPGALPTTHAYPGFEAKSRAPAPSKAVAPAMSSEWLRQQADRDVAYDGKVVGSLETHLGIASEGSTGRRGPAAGGRPPKLHRMAKSRSVPQLPQLPVGPASDPPTYAPLAGYEIRAEDARVDSLDRLLDKRDRPRDLRIRHPPRKLAGAKPMPPSVDEWITGRRLEGNLKNTFNS